MAKLQLKKKKEHTTNDVQIEQQNNRISNEQLIPTSFKMFKNFTNCENTSVKRDDDIIINGRDFTQFNDEVFTHSINT